MSPFAPRYSSWVHMIRHVHYGVTLLIDRDIELVSSSALAADTISKQDKTPANR